MTDKLKKPRTQRRFFTLLTIQELLEEIAKTSTDAVSRQVAKRALAYIKELLP